MNNTIDPAISSLTYRVSQAERKQEETQLLLAQTAESLRTLRQELAVGRLMLKKDNEQRAGAVLAGVLDEHDIVVPPELRISPPKQKRGCRRSGGGNRTATVTAKRWALWRLQREQGYSFQQIARAWKCNHSTIVNASERKFKPYACR
jgi:hypothetical protein